ncbi:LysR substrate-binding domain-containing protein [Arenivirga flava]|uniref:LysR family transcriptional regulator n=1 Tax=Arenivirga flava TaxID=1930060 RepID=A0AA37UEQ9_9MICO|nr:LysR substrate-binding domain-containing protein [Arenivirga flava]GMA28854.1 LysR family transcriptional regulator [Arenivirga flava]
MFDLRLLRYFVAVAEELHFGRAAARLQMSQPPLSQAIRALELDIGAILINRSSRRVELTPVGRVFLNECRDLLEHADRVAASARHADAGASTLMRIGTVASALTWPLPGVLALLRERAPDVRAVLREIDTHEAIRLLEAGRIDVAFARLAAPVRGIRQEPLVSEPFQVLLPQTHPAASENGPIALANLANDDWVWLDREVSPDYHDEMSAVCRANGLSPRATHRARSIASQIAMVQCGVGVTVLPKSWAAEASEGVTARSLTTHHLAVSLSVSTRVQMNRAEQLLVDLAREVTAD